MTRHRDEGHPGMRWKSSRDETKVIPEWDESHPGMRWKSSREEMKVIPGWDESHPGMRWRSSRDEMKVIPGWDESHPGLKLTPGWNNSCKRGLSWVTDRGFSFLSALRNKPTFPDRWSRCTIWRHGKAARLLSTIQNGDAQSWILALFGEEFQRDRMPFRS